MPIPDENQKRTDLRKMKVVATGFLAVAAIIYFVCRFLEQRDGAHVAAWVGYVRAAAEAGMVGALADWFAVTALFKHPFGLPIPHTAIIKRKKDHIGEALGGFVESNFLTEDVVAGRVATFDIPQKVGEWMSHPANNARLSSEAAQFVKVLTESVNDQDVIDILNNTVINRIAEPEWGPPIGRLLQQLIADNRQKPVVDLLAQRAHEWAANSGEMIERVIDGDMPSWTPRFAKNLVGEKVHKELVEFTWRVKNEPEHELRRAIDKFLTELATDLQFDPATIAKTEAIKQEVMERKEIQGAAESAWNAIKRMIFQAAEDPNSTLRVKVAQSAQNFGVRLRTDPILVERVNTWIDNGVRYVTTNYSRQIISVITETVQRWDADDASRKIELQVGRDLQFIRINGTVVGALAGLIIYTVSEIIL